MNKQDKETFEKWFKNLDDSFLNRVIKMNRGASQESWKAACEYKDKELNEWKEAARSEAQMLNEERERSKILFEALQRVKKDMEQWSTYDVQAALKKYKGEA